VTALEQPWRRLGSQVGAEATTSTSAS
jgi:hypothetical protein